jgi:capsular polysaccharide transport system permease protein
MQESFDVYNYAGFLRERWRFIAIACIIAGVLSVAMTLITPKRYTAVARLVIEPPAGSDARTPQIVSPQYLELLKTYEHFATSDTLFRRAVDHFGLRSERPGRPIEQWKRAVLKAGLVRNTKVLEIAVTLEDPKKAQAMAQYLGEQTIEITETLNRESDNSLIREAEAQQGRARDNYEKTEAASSRIIRDEPVEALESEIYALELRRLQIDRRLIDTEVRSTGKQATEEDKSREQVLLAQRKALEDSLTRATALVAQRKAKRMQIDQERKTASARYENALRQYEDARATAAYRGERLRLIDPGIVPEQASSPKLSLNVMAAVLFAFAASVGYLSLRFGFARRAAND